MRLIEKRAPLPEIKGAEKAFESDVLPNSGSINYINLSPVSKLQTVDYNSPSKLPSNFTLASSSSPNSKSKSSLSQFLQDWQSQAYFESSETRNLKRKINLFSKHLSELEKFVDFKLVNPYERNRTEVLEEFYRNTSSRRSQLVEKGLKKKAERPKKVKFKGTMSPLNRKFDYNSTSRLIESSMQQAKLRSREPLQLF